MVRVIYLSFFFLYEEFSHSTVIPPLIPVSHKFSTFPSHSTVIPLIPLIRFPLISPLIPQFIRFPLISPHSPLIPLSFGFPSFPCHSPHSVSQIPLSFPSFPWVSPPVYPVLSRLFSHGCSLSAVFLFPYSLLVLSRHSPVL